MHSITVTSHINATPDQVWGIVGDPSKISDWHPVISESSVSGSDRSCTMTNGAQIQERIESVDNEGRAYIYTITESPLPLASYRSTISVESEGTETIVTWSANFEPDGAPADEVAKLLTGVYQVGLAALRSTF